MSDRPRREDPDQLHARAVVAFQMLSAFIARGEYEEDVADLLFGRDRLAGEMREAVDDLQHGRVEDAIQRLLNAADHTPASDEPLVREADRVKVRGLPVGARFVYQREVWVIDMNAPSYVAARAEQFSNRIDFYDPVTARKTGDHSWDTEVELISSPASRDSQETT